MHHTIEPSSAGLCNGICRKAELGRGVKLGGIELGREAHSGFGMDCGLIVQGQDAVAVQARLEEGTIVEPPLCSAGAELSFIQKS